MPNLKAKTKYIDLGVVIGTLMDIANDYADLDECKEETVKMCARELRKLPTIAPESLHPKGEWIPSESDFDDDDTLFDVEEWCDWQCTVCHEDICYEDPMERRWLPNFCPNCGAWNGGKKE